MTVGKEVMTLDKAKKLFSIVSNAECYLIRLKEEDSKYYEDINVQAKKLEASEYDKLIFDCSYTEEAKTIRYTMQNIHLENLDSQYDAALRLLDRIHVRFWSNFINGVEEPENGEYLLYINYLVMAANKIEIDTDILDRLSDMSDIRGYIKSRHIANKVIEANKLIEKYTINVNITWEKENIKLEKDNALLETKIFRLSQGVD